MRIFAPESKFSGKALLKYAAIGAITAFFIYSAVSFAMFIYTAYIDEWIDDGYDEMLRDLESDIKYGRPWREAFGLSDGAGTSLRNSQVFMSKIMVVMSVGGMIGLVCYWLLRTSFYAKRRARLNLDD